MSDIRKLEFLTRLKHRLEDAAPDLDKLINLTIDEESSKEKDDIELISNLLSTVESIVNELRNNILEKD